MGHPLNLPVPDLAALARMQQQQAAPGPIGISLSAQVSFAVAVPYDATPTQRKRAALTAKRLLLEFVQAPESDEAARS